LCIIKAGCPIFLKHFQLLPASRRRDFLFALKGLNLSELFVRYFQDADLSFGRQSGLYSFGMNAGVLRTGAKAQVDGILHLGKTVFEQVFTKAGIVFSIRFRFGRQVKKDNEPHNSVWI